MTKTTLMTVAETLNALTNPTEAQAAARDAVNAEIAKNEAKAQANRDLYDAAEEAVMGVLSAEPMTVAEIYDACADDLPDGFSKSKVQWGLLNKWADKVTKIVNPKGANQYTKAE